MFKQYQATELTISYLRLTTFSPKYTHTSEANNVQIFGQFYKYFFGAVAFRLLYTTYDAARRSWKDMKMKRRNPMRGDFVDMTTHKTMFVSNQCMRYS